MSFTRISANVNDFRNDLSLLRKLDWQLGQRDRLMFSFNYNKFNSPGGEITLILILGNLLFQAEIIEEAFVNTSLLVSPESRRS